MTEEKILARVRKLLAMANDERGNEGERDNALRMAHNLLTKHELDMGDVDSHIREQEDPRGHFQNDGWNMLWCKKIRHNIAKLFMCEYYIGKKINATRGEHHFVGRESNATTAMYMSDWIIRSLLKEADRLYKHRLTPEGRSFAVGASDKLRERVKELLETKQAEIASDGRSLVLADLAKTEADANNAFIKEMGTSLTTGKARKDNRLATDAYFCGRDYGGNISLNTQVATTAQAKRLK